jgi:hypothetical protein
MNTSTAATTTTTAANTATKTATPAVSSLASSARFKTFALTFSTFGPVIYSLCLFFNWPMFTFHPATNRIVWGFEAARSGEGPNMLWYGWTATTVLAATVLGIVATLLPESVTRKIPLVLIWLLPMLAIPYVVYTLMPWWTHP